MSAQDLERYETEIELALFQECRAVLPMFGYVVETERRFYLANDVQRGPRRRPARTSRKARRRLGVGHVPPGALRFERAGRYVQGRERRGAPGQSNGEAVAVTVTGA